MAHPSDSMDASEVNVLLMEKVSETAVQAFRQQGFQVREAVGFTEDELVDAIADVHMIGVRSKTQLTKRVIEAGKRLQAIGCFCIGTDQTDLRYASSRGIPVFNAPFANTRSVSELVIALVVMLARQAGDRSMEMHRGTWNKRSDGCYEIRQKTLGIVGYGHVGSQVSILAESMGMHVIFYDVESKLPLGNASPVGSLEELLAVADYVTLHVPADEGTVNLMNRERIFSMKKGSYLINYARGTVVDIEAAAEALRSGHLAGGAFDVFPSEPRGKVDDYAVCLQGCPNTILTPHIGGSTEEAQALIGAEVSSKLIDFLCRGATSGAVNLPEVSTRRSLTTGHSRITCFHYNKPGVLRDINKLLERSNITSQVLETSAEFGYMIVDLDDMSSSEVLTSLIDLKNSIRTRVLYHGPGYVGQRL